MTFLRPGLHTIALLFLFLVATGLAAQTSSNDDIFTISVAAPTLAKDLQVRYFFTGEFGGHGSSVADPIAGNKLVIKTGVEGKSAKTFKAIVYAPGCQFVTITVDDLTDANRQGDFQCQALPTIQLHGRVDRLNQVQRKLEVEALYNGRWEMSFLGFDGGATSPLSLGKATVAADGSFTIELPDFTADPTWPRLSEEAELMFFLKDREAGKRVAPLVVPGHSGNLQVATSYPEVAFEIPEM